MWGRPADTHPRSSLACGIESQNTHLLPQAAARLGILWNDERLTCGSAFLKCCPLEQEPPLQAGLGDGEMRRRTALSASVVHDSSSRVGSPRFLSRKLGRLEIHCVLCLRMQRTISKSLNEGRSLTLAIIGDFFLWFP